MTIVVKSKYKDSIVRLPFGRALKPVSLNELTQSECERFYKKGFTEYFEELDAKPSYKRKKKKNDKNNTGNDSIGLSNTDREGYTD